MGYYSSTLQKGSKGDETKKWQEFLNSQGYGLSVDGDFGDKTYNATIDWQTKNGLTADGIVGANTWGKAGFKNMNTPVSAPSTNPMPTNPTYEDTKWDETAKGQAALGAYTDAKDAVSGYGDFNFSQNGWLENVKQGIQNYGQFSYNVNEDALYQQAVERYKQMGNLAMQDTMGQAAAMTGGYGNSYAQGAGQQAYQSYLQEASDMLPEYYQMALDRYNMGKEDLYNQYGMLMSEYEREYGLHSDEYNKLLDQLGIAKDDYYSGADMHYTEQSNKNNIAGQEFTDAMNIWNAENEQAWNQATWDEDARRRAEDLAWEQKVYEESKVASSGTGGTGGNGGNGGNGGSTSTDTLWYATGTKDDKGNPIFRNSEGKTMAFGDGVNPYTGTKHSDAKYGTFSNGYQPNNIGGTPLKDSGMSTSITGKNQTIWQANGKYWLWRGDLNKYQEVDISDLDQ